MIYYGDVLSYTASIETGFTQAVADVMAQVTQILSLQGINVVNSSNNNGLLSLFEAAATLSGQSSNVTVQIQVTSSFNSEDDVKAICDNAFYQATGVLPTASSIVDQTNTQAGTQAPPTTTGGSDFSLSSIANFGTGSLTGIIIALLAVVGFAIYAGHLPVVGKRAAR